MNGARTNELTRATSHPARRRGAKIIYGGGNFSMGSETTWSGDVEIPSGTMTANAGFDNPASKLILGGGSLVVNGGPLKSTP